MLEELERAVLRAAFAGQLVAQDPADEPAELLLKRIEADRAGQPTSPRRGRRTVSNIRATRPVNEEIV